MEVYSSNEAEERIFEIPIGMSETVERVLRRLVTRPID